MAGVAARGGNLQRLNLCSLCSSPVGCGLGGYGSAGSNGCLCYMLAWRFGRRTAGPDDLMLLGRLLNVVSGLSSSYLLRRLLVQVWIVS
jgi:hypothetical protein